MNASSEYQLVYPSDLFPLGAPVEDVQGTPGCNVQDRRAEFQLGRPWHFGPHGRRKRSNMHLFGWIFHGLRTRSTLVRRLVQGIW